MNFLFSTIGKRGYIADFFREHLSSSDRIIGTGVTEWTPGFSRCDDYALVPPFTSDEYPEAVLELCREHEIDALLSFSDPDVHVLSGIKEALREQGVTAFIPDRRAADIAFDKLETAAFLESVGIDHPRTTIDPTDTGLDFPVFVKPRRGSGSHDNYLVESPDELRRVLERHPDMLIQEYTPGHEINVEVLGDLAGRPIGSSVWTKHSSNLGETELAETTDDPEVQALALRAAEALRVCGPMDIDLMRLDDRIIVIEFNPRFGGGYPVSHLAGADFPGKMLRILAGEELEPDHSYERDVVMMKELRIIGGAREAFLNHGRMS